MYRNNNKGNKNNCHEEVCTSKGKISNKKKWRNKAEWTNEEKKNREKVNVVLE